MRSRDVIALVSIGEAAPGAVPPGLITVAGRTLVERQARQAARAGATRILCLASALPEPAGQRLGRLPGFEHLASVAALMTALAEHRPEAMLLVFEPGALLDERLIEAVCDMPGPLGLAVAQEAIPEGAERLDRESFWAGVLKLPAGQARDWLAEHQGWDPIPTLLRGVAPMAPRIRQESLPRYSEGRRREVPLLWAYPVRTGAAAAETAILAAAQKGCLDWPARFLHPPVENALVRWLWPTAVTPNMVTLATAVLGFVAMGLLAFGLFWPGLVLILLVGPLDGVDGKLARTRIEFSRYGDLEHVLDKVLEYGWFLAMGLWFSPAHGLAAWLVALGILLFALLEAIQGEYFRRFAGRQLDDWGPFERRFRLVAGRRNTFFWALLPFGLAGAWWWGFLFLLGYAALTFIIAEWRFLKALADYARNHSQAVQENFARTSYAFLPKASAGGS
ncbi:CDP-alcohol phosphatidyltransferase family protein [Thermaurantiacus sp.]